MKNIATGIGAVALLAACCVGLPLLFSLGLSVAFTAWIGGAIAGAIALAVAVAIVAVRLQRRSAASRSTYVARSTSRSIRPR